MSAPDTPNLEFQAALAGVRAVANGRASQQRLRGADRLSAAALGGGYLVVCAAGWLISGDLSSTTLAIFVAACAAHALASRVVFESAAGSAVATQPVLVAAVLLLPEPLVPSVVLAGMLLAGRGERSGSRLHDLFAATLSGWHCLGPVTVLALADLPDVSLDHWPVYLVALAAQFALDALVAVVRCSALKIPLIDLSGPLRWSWSIDALLAPIGLIAVIAAGTWWGALLWACTPIALLALLARDRSEHLETAVVITEAFDAAMSAARRDPLTELANRRAWSEATAHAAIAYQADPDHTTVTILVADLDGLKLVNDLFGHEAGDELIRGAGQALRAAAPPDALVARLGGDEFGILLVNGCSADDELVAAVRRATAAAPRVHGCSVSLSVGIASCPPFEAVEAAIVAADQRGFVDKAERRAGRR